ncbi:MAG: hypothetical protein KGL39_15920 [Patescibacteria group bacterium]|nr:hypothetical protein [Patescibacteria group bacterium]
MKPPTTRPPHGACARCGKKVALKVAETEDGLAWVPYAHRYAEWQCAGCEIAAKPIPLPPIPKIWGRGRV